MSKKTFVDPDSSSSGISVPFFTTCSAIEVMTGSMVMMKNTWQRVEMARSWCTVELQVEDNGRAKVPMV
jgi:hypothetical protein